MKTNQYLKAGLLAVIFSVASSCDNFIDDNISPNATTSNPPRLILPALEATLGFTMSSDLYRYSGLWSQQIAAQNGRQTENYDKYVLASTEINGVWRNNLYAGIIADAEEILKKSPAEVHPRYFGIAKVIKAFTYSIIVDFWGDAPFSQAMLGDANLQPSIDDDAAIYPALLLLIDEAIVDLNATSSLSAPAADDLFYNGNAARWIRMANTLKLRLYLHMANVPGFDNSVITNFINNASTTFMTSIDDDFQMSWQTTNRRQNPNHQFFVDRTDDICTSSTLINMMNARADLRRSRYFTPAPFSQALLTTPPTGTTGYAGLQNGFGNGGVNNNLSRSHVYVRGNIIANLGGTNPAGPALPVSITTGLNYDGNTPTNILTFAEYNFIRAELALRYGAPGDPQTFFQAGITASFADAGLAASAATYITSDPDNDLIFNGTITGSTVDVQLRRIIEEKYVANYFVTGEPWSDWRRTGYPILQLLPGTLSPGNGGRVPRVLFYPQQEVDANPNLKAIQRTDLSDRRVFWDTRTTGQE